MFLLTAAGRHPMVEHGDPRCWELGGTRVSRAAFTAIVMILRHSWAIILFAPSAGSQEKKSWGWVVRSSPGDIITAHSALTMCFGPDWTLITGLGSEFMQPLKIDNQKFQTATQAGHSLAQQLLPQLER